MDGINHLEGRVEVYANGAWGTVCDDDWGINDATVVCRQLGFSGATSAKSSAYFGQGSGEIILDNVACTGSESNIGSCSSSSPNCDHSEDAGVICIDDDYRKFLFCVVFQNHLTTNCKPILSSLRGQGHFTCKGHIYFKI